MLMPYSWIDGTSHIGMTSMQQCLPGYDIPEEDLGGPGGACFWFSNYTFIPGNPTLPNYMRTYKDWFIYDWTAKHPWRAPGSAPIFSPCGAAGGNPKGGCEVDQTGFCPGDGYPYGPLAEHYYKHLKLSLLLNGALAPQLKLPGAYWLIMAVVIHTDCVKYQRVACQVSSDLYLKALLDKTFGTCRVAVVHLATHNKRL